jgi:hypothetical protein
MPYSMARKLEKTIIILKNTADFFFLLIIFASEFNKIPFMMLSSFLGGYIMVLRRMERRSDSW